MKRRTTNGAGRYASGYCEGHGGWCERVKYDTVRSLWLCARCSLSPNGKKALMLFDMDGAPTVAAKERRGEGLPGL